MNELNVSILTLASMYSIRLSNAVSFSLRVAKRDRQDMSVDDTNVLTQIP